MKGIILLLTALILSTGLYAQTKTDHLAEGDLIFQTSLSAQSKAIQLATKSRYSHCGLIFKDKDGYYVLEAISQVKRTPLKLWINRGQGRSYVVKRLKNAKQILTLQKIAEMKKIGAQFSGKAYDLAFDWSDDKIYCSELIWKIYQRATGLEVGKLEKLRDFDLTNPIVRKKLKERYGNHIPMQETVISPVSIFNSKLLTMVN
ncbi:YiiX family permuted papain-like enzyme [Pedobacter cryoconitis]|uniref:Permuted papain-like amidase YaeF/Yiix C92 family enzyme n=1 Tax=Pedobacter cryoconitis TaxID=188932 RepID=A0A7X0MJU6_9SPHI|nr:YiiX family permuted papain-like enzyme [Pedobacter cryoconitis]MBB6499985.1 hypothetical protein [Pedobacter cryoconitis]